MIIEKTIVINRPATTVFDFLKETKNQDRFSVWNMKDPGMKKNYTGIDGMTGFVYAWDSTDKSVGAGAQQITSITPGKQIDYKLDFERPMRNTATATFLVEETGAESTSVTWIFRGATKFPMSLLSPIFKNMLGKQLQQSLSNLKRLLESV